MILSTVMIPTLRWWRRKYMLGLAVIVFSPTVISSRSMNLVLVRWPTSNEMQMPYCLEQGWQTDFVSHMKSHQVQQEWVPWWMSASVMVVEGRELERRIRSNMKLTKHLVHNMHLMVKSQGILFIVRNKKKKEIITNSAQYFPKCFGQTTDQGKELSAINIEEAVTKMICSTAETNTTV